MAISTVDILLAASLPPEEIYKDAFTGEAAGQLHSALYLAGRPGAAVAPSPGINGAALTTYAGQVPFPGAATAKNVHLVGLEFAAAAAIGSVILCDRLWHNSGIVVTTTGAQAIATPAWPARDANGSTSGVGVQIAVEVSTVTGNGGAITNTTLSYTNSSGVAARTATIASFPATAVAGTFVPFSLQAGDVGIQSIQSITLGTSYVSGAIHLVAYRRIAACPLPTANVAAARGPAELGMPRMYDSSVPWLVYLLTGTGAGLVTGSVQLAQG